MTLIAPCRARTARRRFRRRGAGLVLVALASLAVAACAAPRLPGGSVAALAPTPAPEILAQADPDNAADAAVRIDIDARPAVESRSQVGDYLAGRYAYEEHDFWGAADFFARALAEDPENLPLLRATLRMQLAAGWFDQAVPMARRVAALDPLDPVSALTLMVVEVRQGDYPAAEGLIEKLAHDGVNRLILPVIEAWLEFGRSGADAAMDRLASLEATASFAVFHDFNAALIDDLAGRPERARASFESALDEIGAESLRLVLGAGSFFERQGEIERARSLYEEYVASHPTSTWLDDAFARLDAGRLPSPLVEDVAEGIAETLYGTAGTLPQQQQDEAGLIYAQLALQLRPEFIGARVLLGELYESLDRPVEAVEQYRAVDLGASSAWSVRIRIAVNLDHLGRTEEAIALLREMGDERPERTDALIALGDILRTRERFAEAVEAYDAALARQTDVAPEHWTLFYTRGVSLERSKRWADAERDFLKALELEPDQPFVLNYLGYSWIERGEHLTRAREMIERAVELRPNDGFIIDSLGWAMYRQGDYQGAVTELERAIELQPDDPTINDHLGDAYWRVERRNEARFQWERALLFDTEGEFAPDLRRKLDHGLDAPGAAGPEL